MIGKSIGFLAFSAERNRRFCCLGELVPEFVGKNLWAKASGRMSRRDQLSAVSYLLETNRSDSPAHRTWDG